MSRLIAALDRALALAGEDVILRRTVGDDDASAVVYDVTCRARVDGIDNTINAAGLRVSEFNLIISPTQLSNDETWPGGIIPRVNSTDQVILRSEPARTIVFVDPKVIGGELVRINLRCVG